MSVYKPKNSPYFHFDFVWKGNRFHGSTGCTSKQRALEFERRERHKAALPDQGRPPITVDEAGGLYEEHAQYLDSWPTIKYMLEALVHGLGPNKLLSEVSQRNLQEYFAKRRDGRSNASINREIENCRAVWIRASKARYDVGEMPEWRALMLKVVEKTPRELAYAEEDALMPAISEDLRDFCEFALISGWRRAEVMGLRWSDCDFPNMQAMTRIKGGNVIKRPITTAMMALIANQPKEGPFVFTYVCRQSRAKRRKGQRYPVTPSLLRDRWQEAREAAKIENFRFHDLRHTRGTRIVRQTRSLAAAKKALEHKNIKTTLRYAHVLDEDVRNALDESGRRDTPAKPKKVKAVRSAS